MDNILILLIDNYDSFTFIIYDYLLRANANITVMKDDELKRLTFSKIVISSDPGTPDNAGISLAAIAIFANSFSILGICLGHQAIAQYYGYKIAKVPMPVHGKIDEIVHDNKGLFTGIKNPLNVVRYHLLFAYDNILVNSLPMVIIAKNKQGLIIGATP